MRFEIIRFYGASLTPGGYLFNLRVFELNVHEHEDPLLRFIVADLVRTRKELLSVTAWTPRRHWFYSRLVKRWLRMVEHERITIRGGGGGGRWVGTDLHSARIVRSSGKCWCRVYICRRQVPHFTRRVRVQARSSSKLKPTTIGGTALTP